MNCKRIQELILTDYLDDEINKESIDQHVANCKECREFLALAKKVTIEPLKNAKKDHLSRDVIWSRIQDEIRKEENCANEYYSEPNFLEKLKNAMFLPKPVLALSAFAVLVVAVLVLNFSAKQLQLAKNISIINHVSVTEKKADIKSAEFDQEIYLAYFFNQSESSKNYGTSLEEYFL